MASRLGVLGAGTPRADLCFSPQEQWRSTRSPRLSSGLSEESSLKFRVASAVTEGTSDHSLKAFRRAKAPNSAPLTPLLHSRAAPLSSSIPSTALPGRGKGEGRGDWGGRAQVSACAAPQNAQFATSAAAMAPLASAVAPEQAAVEAPRGTQYRAPTYSNATPTTSTSTSTARTDRSSAGASSGQPVILSGDLSAPGSAPPLAYEMIQGPLVRWSLPSPASPASAYAAPPTAVFLHGILGSRKNWVSFARRMAREFPAWQMLLVDLRCHGDSAAGAPAARHRAPHSVASAARDVLQLIRHLKLVPRVLVGHSFGGKVALSMVDQAAKPLAKPVQVWVLDATPGEVRAGGDGEDHPAELIEALAAMRGQGPITDRKQVVSALCAQGFSTAVAQWMTTNLRPAGAPGTAAGQRSPQGGALEWIFELEGIAEMYRSYEATDLWPMVEGVPEGVRIEFLRAERSLHRWAQGDVQRIGSAELRAQAEGAGVRMHVLEDAGHWVHTDNPDGLFRILAPSFM